MGPPIADPGEEAGGSEDIRKFLPIGSPGKPYIWVRYMGRDPLHGNDTGRVSTPGRNTAHGKTPLALSLWDMELFSIGRCHAGNGDRGDVGIYWEAT